MHIIGIQDKNVVNCMIYIHHSPESNLQGVFPLAKRDYSMRKFGPIA